jgi:hypothetical protein
VCYFLPGGYRELGKFGQAKIGGFASFKSQWEDEACEGTICKSREFNKKRKNRAHCPLVTMVWVSCTEKKEPQ